MYSVKYFRLTLTIIILFNCKYVMSEQNDDNDATEIAPLVEELKNQSVFVGDKVVFTCGTLKSSMAHIAWYKLNVSMQDLQNISEANFIPIHLPYSIEQYSQSYTVEQVQDTTNDPNLNENSVNAADKQIEKLTIENVTAHDAGTFMCVIGNGFSTRLNHAYLHVYNRNLMPIDEQRPLTTLFYIFPILFVTLLVFGIALLAIMFYYRKNRKDRSKDNKKLLNNVLKTNLINESGSLQKGFESMKQNILYQAVLKSVEDQTNKHTSYYINDFVQNSNTISSNDSENSRTKFIDSIRKIDSGLLQSLFKMDELNLPLEMLKIDKKIGEGAFGVVYSAELLDKDHKSTTVAVKSLRESASVQELSNFIKEIEIMRNVGQHPNIVALLGVSQSLNGSVLAVVEHAKYGNLRDYLRNKRMHNYFAINLQRNVNVKSQISNLMSLLSSSTSSHDKYEESINFKDLLMFAHQISLGMDYLHTKNVLHRDLAARNILVCENRVAKIADFGLARDMEQNYYYKRQTDGRLPVKWMAPECLFDRKAYPNSDIWSYGVLLWEIFSLGGTPYPSVPVEKLYDYLKEGGRMSKPAYANNEIYSLMLQCWQYMSPKRPNFKEIRIFLDLQLKKTLYTMTSTICSISAATSHNDLTGKIKKQVLNENEDFANLITKRYYDQEDEESPDDEDDTTPNTFSMRNQNKFDFNLHSINGTSMSDRYVRDSQYYSGTPENNSLSSANDTFGKIPASTGTIALCPDSNDSNYESGSSSYYSSLIENKKQVDRQTTPPAYSVPKKTVLVHLNNDGDNRKYRNKIVKKFLLSSSMQNVDANVEQ